MKKMKHSELIARIGLLLLCVFSGMAFVTPSSASVTDLDVSPQVVEPGDVISISGKASPFEEIWLNYTFEISSPVSDEKYSREFIDMHLLAGEKVFSVTAENVKNVRVSFCPVFWQTVEFPLEGPQNATGSIATVSLSFPMMIYAIEMDMYGKKNISVYGDAADDATSVNIKISQSIKVTADSNGDFFLDINTEGIPEGELLISAGEIEKTVHIGSTPLTLGKGIWIWKLNEAEGGNVDAIIERCENVGIEWVAIKCGDGGYFWSQCKLSTIEQFQNAGIKVFGWQYVYGDDPIGEASVAKQILDLGVEGFIIDAEAEYEGKPDKATIYLEDIREEHSDSFIAYTTFPIIDYHTDFPYLEFGKYCDAVMPQDYWKEIGVTPEYMVEWMEEQWKMWHKIWEEGGYSGSVKHIIPLGQGGDVSGSEITRFCNLVYDRGYGGVSLWRYGTMTEENWNAYAECFAPKPSVEITTDKEEYTTGETMSINITLNNPTEEWQPAYFAWRLDLPDYDLQYWIMIEEIYLPPDYEETFTIPFTLGDYGAPFSASWYVALANTATYEIISEDTADWRYTATKKTQGRTVPAKIVKEITKTIERVELQS